MCPGFHGPIQRYGSQVSWVPWALGSKNMGNDVLDSMGPGIQMYGGWCLGIQRYVGLCHGFSWDVWSRVWGLCPGSHVSRDPEVKGAGVLRSRGKEAGALTQRNGCWCPGIQRYEGQVFWVPWVLESRGIICGLCVLGSMGTRSQTYEGYVAWVPQVLRSIGMRPIQCVWTWVLWSRGMRLIQYVWAWVLGSRGMRLIHYVWAWVLGSKGMRVMCPGFYGPMNPEVGEPGVLGSMAHGIQRISTGGLVSWGMGAWCPGFYGFCDLEAWGPVVLGSMGPGIQRFGGRVFWD
jgi:hypothetical protein